MASLVSHGIVAIALGKIAFPDEVPPKLWLIAIACSMFPDLDVVGFGFGIRYGDFLGHRGFTHSLLFAAILSLLIVRFADSKTNRPWNLRLFFFLVTASHGFLDAMTDGGLGVAFFSPFDRTRYFLPWRPVHVSPIGLLPFFSERGLQVLLSEVVWIWIPVFLFVVAGWILRSARKKVTLQYLFLFLEFGFNLIAMFSWKYLMLLLIPLSVVLEHFHASPIVVFVTASLSIIPLAEWMRHATEQMSARAGSAIGGLLNVTFGNSAELILAIFVLKTGNTEVVKATITGAIIGNSLVGLGLAILVGSWGRARQTFKRDQAGLLGSLLILSVIALMVPALFDYTERGLNQAKVSALDEHLSLGVAGVLIFVYVANLIYTLVTHRDVFAMEEEDENHHAWPVSRSLMVLLVATAAVSLEAEMVSGALEQTASGLGLSPFFLGIIVLPFVGNAAEYFSVVYFARKNRMGLVMNIALGASIQVALFTAPLLVFVSYAMGKPMNLVFSNPLELIAIAGVAFAVNSIALDGETTWFEGLLLLAVYALLVLAFFFVTP